MAPSTAMPKVLFAGGIAGFAYYMVMRKYWFPDPSKTPAVQNIENRYSAGGGAHHEQPGTATKRGSAGDTEPRHTNK